MAEKRQINNFFNNPSSYTSKVLQEKDRIQNNNKSTKCKQKVIDNNNPNNNNFNNYCASKKSLHSSTNGIINNSNSNNNKLVNEGEKPKKQTCKAKNKERDKINENIESEDFMLAHGRKNKNSSVKNILMYRNCKNNKNKDNNTKMYDEPFIDGFENLEVNNEDTDEKKDNIFINNIPPEKTNNLKAKQTYFINKEKDNNNLISNSNPKTNNIKKILQNIDNNEVYNNDDFENVKNGIKIKKAKNVNEIEKNKGRNLSCRVKKKKIISISSGDNYKEKDGIILFENGLKVNDCFLNSIIQVLFHLEEFKYKLFELEIHQDLKNPISQLYIIFDNYKALSKHNAEDKLNAALLRKSLHHTYGTYQKGKCGDPMETISQILELIHTQYFQNSDKSTNNTTMENNNNVIFCQNELCPSHSNFLLCLKEIKYCPECKAKNMQMYDKDCFMYSVLSYEILSLINNESFTNYKYSLFTKLKQLSQSFGDNKQKLEKCKCKEIKTVKRLYLYNKFSPYLIINITWDTDFPKMGDICKIYGIIPIIDANTKLFGIDFEKGKKTKKDLETNYYLYSMILYGQNHYTCFFYNKVINKWSFIDDDNLKNFETYHELINYLIIRRSIPVGIFFYHKKIYDVDVDNADKYKLNEEEFEKLYQKSIANDKKDLEENKNEEIINNQNYINNVKNNNIIYENNANNIDKDEEVIKIKRKKKK